MSDRTSGSLNLRVDTGSSIPLHIPLHVPLECLKYTGSASPSTICTWLQRFEMGGTLKTLDTIGNCQRPGFSLGVSQHKDKKNKPVKIGRWSCEIIMELCASRCLISIPQNIIMRSRNQIRWKVLLSWKPRYFRAYCSMFRGSRFSHTINSSPLLVTK